LVVEMPLGELKCRGNLRSRQLANAKKRIKDAFGGIWHAVEASEASFLPTKKGNRDDRRRERGGKHAARSDHFLSTL
jgi:hypothetical protein